MAQPSLSGFSGLSENLQPLEGFGGGFGAGDLDAEIAQGVDRPAPALSSPNGLAGIFDDNEENNAPGPVEQEEDYAPYVPDVRPPLNIGGLTAQDIINLAMNKKRAPGELLVLHVMPNIVKPISIPDAVGKGSWDVLDEMYTKMSDGTSDAFNVKMAIFEEGIGGLITIASSTNDEAIFRDCILDLGLRKVDEKTIYFHTSFAAIQKTFSWQEDAVTDADAKDLEKAVHLMVAMQTFKDDENAGSFDGSLGDAIISLPARLGGMNNRSVFDLVINTATNSAKEIDRPFARTQIQAGIKAVQAKYAA